MSTAIATHQPCDTCGSKDALAKYSDGHTYCFSCATLKGTKEIPMDDKVSYEYIDIRGISKETLQFFGTKVRVSGEGKPLAIGLPYGTRHLVRSLETKTIRWSDEGEYTELFGMSKFGAGSAKAITITEGAFDAMAAWEMLGHYPAVSVRSSVTAETDCRTHFDYLNSFDKIYICFDNDPPGHKATKEVAGLFDANKVYVVKMDRYKDANEYLEKGAIKEFISIWWASKKFIPKNILVGRDAIQKVLEAEEAQSVASFPFPTLNTMSYGIRLGEITLFTALEKVGKTAIMHAIEAHLLKTTDDNIGIIHLEEKEKRTVQALVSYQLRTAAHLPGSGLSVQDQLLALDQLTRKDDRVHLYTHFGSDDPDTILNAIRYLAAVSRCKYIFLDHIGMIVSGHEGDDERRTLDYISTRLAMLTRELNFHLFLVSHVNDNGQTRGSRYIAKIPDLLVHLDRNPEAHEERERNTTKLMVRGNRFGSVSGPAGQLVFDPKTFTLSEASEIQEVTFDTSIVPPPEVLPQWEAQGSGGPSGPAFHPTTERLVVPSVTEHTI